MKKYVLGIACFFIAYTGMAQKQNIQNALNAQSDKEYPKAIEYIDKATTDETTKDNPKTWYVRGTIYLEMQGDAKYKDTHPYRKGAESFLKAYELDPKYEREAVTGGLRVAAYNYYNDLVTAFNSKQYEDAFAYSQMITRIFTLDNGKKYGSEKSFDTLATEAKLFGAYSAVNINKTDEALPILLEMKNNPKVQSVNIYLMLVDIYKKMGKEDEVIKIIDEGRKAYPANKQLETEELTYYTRTGKQDEFLKKLEDAAAKDPSNANYQSVLATAYTTMAFPRDNAGKSLPKPANYADYIEKANNAYTNLIKVAGDDAVYNYNAGAFYYNQASDYVSQMNAIEGTSAEDKRKVDVLSKKASDAFEQSVGYFEKTVSVMEPQFKTLSNDDKSTYWSTLTALKQIYTRQNKMDKVAEVKVKMDAMKK